MKYIIQASLLLCMVSAFGADSNSLHFFVQGLQNARTVGTVFQCSSYTGDELSNIIDLVPADEQPRHFAELGAGNGAVTVRILYKLAEQGRLTTDRLDVYEYLPECCERLRARFPQDLYPNIRIIEGDFLTSPEPAQPYNAVVSTLPYNAWSEETVQNMLAKISRITAPNGYYSDVMYAFAPTLRVATLRLLTLFLYNPELARVLQLRSEFAHSNNGTSSIVWRNMPPIWVNHMQLNSNK